MWFEISLNWIYKINNLFTFYLFFSYFEMLMAQFIDSKIWLTQILLTSNFMSWYLIGWFDLWHPITLIDTGWVSLLTFELNDNCSKKDLDWYIDYYPSLNFNWSINWLSELLILVLISGYSVHRLCIIEWSCNLSLILTLLFPKCYSCAPVIFPSSFIVK